MIFKQIQRIVPLPDNSSKSLACTWNITIVFHTWHLRYHLLFQTCKDCLKNMRFIAALTLHCGIFSRFCWTSKDCFFSPSLSLSLLFEWGDLWARELYRPMKSINETDLDFTYLLICIYGQRPTKAYHIYLYIATLSFHGIDFAYFFLLWTSPLPLHLTAKMGPGHVDPETRRRRRRSVIRWTEVNIRWTPGKQNVKVMRSLASPWSLMISWICILWSNMGYHDLSGFVFGKSSNKLCVEAFFTHSLDISLQMDFNDLRRSRWGECVKLPSLWLGPMRFLYFCGQEVLNTAVRCKDPI